MTTNSTIVLTTEDHARLSDLIAANGHRQKLHDHEAFHTLTNEVRCALIVKPAEMPRHVVTMNSMVSVLDMDTQERMTFTLCWPEEADPAEGRINVLAPLGMALLGTMTDEEVLWRIPSGIRRLRIENVLYQPEAEYAYRVSFNGSRLAFHPSEYEPLAV